MDKSQMRHRAAAIVLSVALAAVALAPAAEAGHGRVRYKGQGPWYGGGYRVMRVERGPFFVVHRHSDFAPAFAGFIGGLVLGAVLSNAQAAAPPPPAYYYYDPWCRERFSSLDDYQDHLYGAHHPGTIEVREAHSGRCVDEYDWRDGAWRSVRDEDRRDDRNDRQDAGPEVDPNWEN